MRISNRYRIKQLLREVAQDDTEAFEMVSRMYKQPVYQFLLQYLKCPILSDSLTQGVFLKLWNDRKAIMGIRNLDGYLFKMTEQTAIDYLKLFTTDVQAKSTILGAYQKEVIPEDEFKEKGYAAFLNNILNSLTPQSRLQFQLCWKGPH